MSAAVDLVLSRLDGVRRSARGWAVRCPAHDDRTASLSIAAADDGRVLLHCFAGCEVADVLAAIGLQVGDLFPRRITHASTPAERAAAREAFRRNAWAAALGVLSRESFVVQIAAADVRAGAALTDSDAQRLALACERIDRAREVLQ